MRGRTASVARLGGVVLSLGRFEVRAAADGIVRGAEFLGLAELSDCLIYACVWRTMLVNIIFVEKKLE